LTAECEQHGVEYWAQRTMGSRLGRMFPPDGVEWWTRFMGRAALATQLGFMETIPHSDIRANLPKIKCPTLVVTTEENPMSPVAETRAWQQMIPDSALCVLPGNSPHVAASDPKRCAQATLDFIRSKA
jgi:pimeloyl-ACP methyl ester carboxylesterase